MKRLLLLIAMVLGLLMQAGNLFASAFRVTPVRVALDRNSASALLTLSNESQEPLRFQISAFAWSQDAKGLMQLDPTQDITFFPALVTLKPGEERKVRVGTKAVPAALEKSYRMFFEELPPLTTPESAAQGAQVRILTKMGVPVFVAPQKISEVASIDGARIENGTLRFDLKNEGSVHFAVQGVKLRGVGANDTILFEHQLDGWYVLAGTHRSYDYPLPADVCQKVKHVTITAQTDSSSESAKTATRRVDVSAANCR